MNIPTLKQHLEYLGLVDLAREKDTPERVKAISFFLETHQLWEPTIIDGGCTTLKGLEGRASLFRQLHGEAKIRPHPAGLALDFDQGVRILLTV